MIFIHPTIPLILLGFAYSLVAAIIYPSISLLVNQKNFGIAFGILTSLQNLGFTLIPMYIGYIL